MLLFPLQRFQWRSGIIESVAATLNTYADLMRHNPLDPEHLRHRHIPLLLIFDGLDELAANTEVSEAISATFLRELAAALRNWENRPVWAIVTGRDAIFGNVEGPMAKLPGERFHLLPYHVREHEPGSLSRKDYHDPNGLLLTDNREEAFRKFAKAKGQPSDNLPEMYRNQSLHDVSAQPLLNYFMLTSTPDEISDGNLARIYSSLFERLHARNRNILNMPRDEGKPGASLSQDQFDRIFEAMAVAAWRTGGSRAASWDDLLSEAAREDSYPTNKPSLREVFESHMHERGAPKPFRLAAAFFMRNEQAMGVEFTHKSFGDYLYARRLVKALSEMGEVLAQTPAVEREMLHQWETLTADQCISPEVRRFLELEIAASLDAQTRGKLHATLASTVEKLLRDGRPMPGDTTQRQAEQRAAQMEEALFVAWHGLWCPADGGSYWSIGEHTGDLLWRALGRQQSAHGLHRHHEFSKCWCGADFRNEFLQNVDFTGINLSDANFENAQLTGARLCHSNLYRAKFRGAEIDLVDFSHTSLEGADLSGTLLVYSQFCRANLAGATIEGFSRR